MVGQKILTLFWGDMGFKKNFGRVGAGQENFLRAKILVFDLFLVRKFFLAFGFFDPPKSQKWPLFLSKIFSDFSRPKESLYWLVRGFPYTHLKAPDGSYKDSIMVFIGLVVVSWNLMLLSKQETF